MSQNNQWKSKSSTGRRGGARKGAGRKPGSATRRTREIADRAATEGITPLEFMLQVMRAEPPEEMEPSEMVRAMTLRFEAAKAAAPYMHPRLAAIEHSGKDGGDLLQQTSGVLVVPGLAMTAEAWSSQVTAGKTPAGPTPENPIDPGVPR